MRVRADGRGHLLLVAPNGFGKTSTLRHLERSGRTLGLTTEHYPVAVGTALPAAVPGQRLGDGVEGADTDRAILPVQ